MTYPGFINEEQGARLGPAHPGTALAQFRKHTQRRSADLRGMLYAAYAIRDPGRGHLAGDQRVRGAVESVGAKEREFD